MTFSALKETLRTGTWVSRPRVRLWACALLIGFAAALAYLFATANGPNDFLGRPLGADFSDVYAAGKLAGVGVPQDAYDFVRHYEAEKAIFGLQTPFYGWHYPPFFLTVAKALAHLPYLSALLCWQGLTFALYLGSLFLLTRTVGLDRDRLWLLLAIAFPAVFVNLTHGQNGFLTAALFGAALAMLDTRPALAGILFGLLIYKPQFAMFVPVVLIAGRRWKSLTTACAAVAALILLTTVVFGMEIWTAFLASTRFRRQIVLEQGGAGFEKIQSAFAFVRHIGGSVEAAYAVQAAFSLWVLFTLVRLWRSGADFATKAIGLVLASLLATPYVMDYDLVALAPAILLATAHLGGRRQAPYAITMMAVLWGCPIVTRSVASATYFPFGFVCMAIVYAQNLGSTRQG